MNCKSSLTAGRKSKKQYKKHKPRHSYRKYKHKITRRRQNYKGGNFTCPYPTPSRVRNVLGSTACNISRGGTKKLKNIIRHQMHYNKCGPMPWPIHSKCKPPYKCSKKIGHPAGIGHGRGSHTCY